MPNKSNESTPQRPEGDRLLDAPLVTMNLTHLIEQIRHEPSWKDSDRNSITIYKSGSVRIVLIGLHEDAELKKHTANGIITVHVLEGHIKFTTEQEVVELEKEQMLALQKQIPHSVFALKESFFLLTMSMVE
jgi:quercetin dioxygenase-like cupin family protein